MSSRSIESSQQVDEVYETTRAKYRADRILGEGAFGTVCAAYDRQDMLPVLLEKIPFPKDCSRKTIIKEMSLMRLLVHPCINHLRACYTSHQHVYVVYDYCEWTSLADYMSPSSKSKKVNEKVLFTWFWQIVSGIEYCHDSGVTGLTLVPGQILLDWEGNVKLIDVGMRSTLSLPLQHEYTAPEVSKGEAFYFGDVADMYTLGLLMFMIFTRRHPFRKARKPVFPSNITVDFKECFYSLTNFIPHARMTLRELKSHIFWISNCKRFGLSIDGCRSESQLSSPTPCEGVRHKVSYLGSPLSKLRASFRKLLATPPRGTNILPQQPEQGGSVQITPRTRDT